MVHNLILAVGEIDGSTRDGSLEASNKGATFFSQRRCRLIASCWVRQGGDGAEIFVSGYSRDDWRRGRRASSIQILGALRTRQQATVTYNVM